MKLENNWFIFYVCSPYNVNITFPIFINLHLIMDIERQRNSK
jgi:hypothetical protein